MLVLSWSKFNPWKHEMWLLGEYLFNSITSQSSNMFHCSNINWLSIETLNHFIIYVVIYKNAPFLTTIWWALVYTIVHCSSAKESLDQSEPMSLVNWQIMIKTCKLMGYHTYITCLFDTYITNVMAIKQQIWMLKT